MRKKKIDIAMLYRPEVRKQYRRYPRFVKRIADASGYPRVLGEQKDSRRNYRRPKGERFCALCRKIRPLESHHIVDHAEGGITDKSLNRLPACGECHTKAGWSLWSREFLLEVQQALRTSTPPKLITLDLDQFLFDLNCLLIVDPRCCENRTEEYLKMYDLVGHVAWKRHRVERILSVVRILRRLSAILTTYGYDIGEKEYSLHPYPGTASFKRYVGIHLLHQALTLMDWILQINPNMEKSLEIDKYRITQTLALHYRALGDHDLAYRMFIKQIGNLFLIKRKPVIPAHLFGYLQSAFTIDCLATHRVTPQEGIRLSDECIRHIEWEDATDDLLEHLFGLKHAFINCVQACLIAGLPERAKDYLAEAKEKIGSDDDSFTVMYRLYAGKTALDLRQFDGAREELEAGSVLARTCGFNDLEEQTGRAMADLPRKYRPH